MKSHVVNGVGTGVSVHVCEFGADGGADGARTRAVRWRRFVLVGHYGWNRQALVQLTP